MHNSSVLVDTEYRTGLGTGFYDRLDELDELATSLRAYRSVIIYGPRGVGKSELARYYLARRHRGGAVVVDARERKALELVPGGTEPLRLLRDLLGLLGGPVNLVDLVAEIARSARRPSLVLLDEFHLFFTDTRQALVALESLTGYLAKKPHGTPSLLVTVSEGFFATTEALSRLTGYSTRFLLVEPMESRAFAKLYQEYREKNGCKRSLDEITGLAGPNPGYLVELCSLDEKMLVNWVSERLTQLSHAVYRAALELGENPLEATREANEILHGARPRTPRQHLLGEILVKENIAYPCPAPPRRYLPQLPVYVAALEQAAEKQVPPDELPVEEVLENTRKLKQAAKKCR